MKKAPKLIEQAQTIGAQATYAKGWFTVITHSGEKLKFRAIELENYIRNLTTGAGDDTLPDASNAGNTNEEQTKEDNMTKKKVEVAPVKKLTGKARTKLIRAGDLSFLCVCSGSNIKGGGIGDGATGAGSNMGMAFDRCKRAADKKAGAKGSKSPVFVIYASSSDDIELNASGHVTATDPVLRLTQVDKDGRVYGK